MFTALFEVLPAAGKKDEYLTLVQHLKPVLESIDGYVESERFESRLRPGWILALQTWRDEKSVVRWRTKSEHHAIQLKGRFEIFQDYHIRLGDTLFDTNPPAAAPIRPMRFDETEIGAGKIVTITEATLSGGAKLLGATDADSLPASLGLDLQNSSIVDHDTFQSINEPSKIAFSVGWQDEEAANRWTPNASGVVEKLRHRRIRIVRDYGRFDRREAPHITRMPEAAKRSTLVRPQLDCWNQNVIA